MSSAQPPNSTPRWAAAASVVAVLTHLPALANGLVWLDHGDLEAGAALAPPSGWLGLFAEGYARTGFYRPLTALTLSVDAVIGGGAPWAFHAGNVLWHALAAAAVVLAGKALKLPGRAPLWAGLLFAVHPAGSMVVNLVTARGDSLAALGLFGLLAFHAAKRPWAAAAALAFACLSKETAFVLAPLFLAVAPRGTRRLYLVELGAWTGCVALRLAFAPAWRSTFPPLPLAQAVGTRLAVLARGALELLVPADRQLCDAFAVVPWWSFQALLGAAVLALLVVSAWRVRGAALLLLGTCLPLLNLVPLPRVWSPHYLYLPLAAAALWLAAAVERALTSKLSRVVAPLGAALLMSLAAVSFTDSFRYRDDLALFNDEVAAHPQCREARLYLGDGLRARGDLHAAAAHYQAAASPPAAGYLAYSDEGAALQNLGLVRLQQGQWLEAELAFDEALTRPLSSLDQRQVNHDLAAVAVARGDPAGAERLLRPEVDRSDALPESVALLARALEQMGRGEEARALLERLRPGP